MPLQGAHVDLGIGKVGAALLRTQDRIEPLGVEVQEFDLVAAIAQGLQGAVAKGRAVAAGCACAQRPPRRRLMSSPKPLLTNWVVATLERSTSPGLYSPAATILS